MREIGNAYIWDKADLYLDCSRFNLMVRLLNTKSFHTAQSQVFKSWAWSSGCGQHFSRLNHGNSR